MGQAVTFDELRGALNRRLVNRSLRASGIGSLIFGTLALARGVSATGMNSLNGILAMLGGFLLIDGVLALSTPSPWVLIIDGVAFMLVGLWNVAVNFVSFQGGNEVFFALGFLQLGWGIQRFAAYGRFSRTPSGDPSEEAVRWIDGLIKEITAKRFSGPDAVEFRSRPSWRVKFLGDAALFVMGKGQDAMFATKSEINLVPQGQSDDGRPVKAELRVGTRKLKGKISPDDLRRYQAWRLVG